MNTEQKLKAADFFAAHPIFSLDEAIDALAPGGKSTGIVDRLKYHLKTGRLKRVTREIYAVVPASAAVENFRPDPLLVASVMQPTGVILAPQRLGTSRRRTLNMESVHPLRREATAPPSCG